MLVPLKGILAEQNSTHKAIDKDETMKEVFGQCKKKEDGGGSDFSGCIYQLTSNVRIR